jgi:hypothetical protein
MLSITIGYNKLRSQVRVLPLILLLFAMPCLAQEPIAAAKSCPCDENTPTVVKKKSKKKTSKKKPSKSSVKGNFSKNTATSNTPLPVEKLSPAARGSDSNSSGTVQLDWRALEAFAGNTVLLSIDEGKQSGRVLKSLKDNELILPGDLFAGTIPGLPVGQRVFLAQPGKTLKLTSSPELLGYFSEIIGQAEIVQSGAVATLKLVKSRQDILPGTWIITQSPESYIGLIPQSSPADINGEVVGIVRDHEFATRDSVVAVALPADRTLERGSVLDVVTAGETIRLKEFGTKRFTLPDVVVGKGIVLSNRGRLVLTYIQEASTEIRVGTPVFGSNLIQ